MKKITLVVIAIFFAQITFAQWTPLDFFATVFDITFTPQGTGYAASGYSVLKSTNGTVWNPVYSTTVQDEMVLSVSFPDENTGYASCMKGIILKTTDAGATWSVLPTGTTENLWCITFINTTTGYAGGEGGVILKTTDGGNTWTTKTTTSGTVRDLYFKNENFGLATPNSGPILQTQDGGVHWLPIVLAGVTNMFSICFPSENTGYMCGQTDQLEPVIIKSTDGGYKWDKLNVTTGHALSGIYFTSENTGYAVGLNCILKTTDGGATWGGQTVPLAQLFNCVIFTDESHGYIGGAAAIYVTSNGGGPIGIDEKENVEFSISPNPAKDVIRIAAPEIQGACSITISDITGNTIKSVNSVLPVSIDVSGLKTGLYLINVNNGMHTFRGKFVISL